MKCPFYCDHTVGCDEHELLAGTDDSVKRTMNYGGALTQREEEREGNIREK
jgi:hypothetical protein